MALSVSKGGGSGSSCGSELQVRGGGGVMVQGLRKWPKDHHGRDECSPERTKVWTEPPPKLRSNFPNNNNVMFAAAAGESTSSSKKMVAVVYYLCRNGQLEHPHFIQVPLSSSPDGLFLRDVINRLNVLRGKGMASQYSWSSKRSYKNGYVWQDLDENDLIQPVHGHEYVLKGSEIFFQQTPSSSSFSSTIIPPPPAASSSSNSAADKQQQYPLIHNTHDEESDFPIIIRDGIGTPQHHDNSRLYYNNNRRRNQSWSSSEYKVYKTDLSLPSEFSTSKAAGGADAATQTDDKRRRRRTPPAVQVNEEEHGDSNQADHKASGVIEQQGQDEQIQQQQQQQSTELRREEISPPPSDSSPETLETLMKADGRLLILSSKTNPHHQPPPLTLTTTTTTTQPTNPPTAADDEGFQNLPTNGRMKASSVLMSLFTCGSISFRDCGAAAVKDHGLSLVSSSNSHYIKAPRLFPCGSAGGNLNQLQTEDYRTIENGSSSFRKMVLEDREFFSGSLLVDDDKKNKGDEFVPSTSTSSSVLFKRSSSYNADRSSHLKLEEKELDGVRAKCLPRKPKTKQQQSYNQQPPPQPNKKKELLTCSLTTNSANQHGNNADQVTDAPR